jgi:glutathione S-transferase
MPELILHHYPNSPFAEKLRLMLGYKGLAWRSCLQPDIMPKADLQALTGGYRRIPVLQVGADIYCDTALVTELLESVQPTSSLFPTGVPVGVVRTLAQWADDKLFWAAMGYNFIGASVLFKGASAEEAKASGLAFADDRSKMMMGNMARSRPADATMAYKNYLIRLESMLERQDFLLGAAPCLADFACYHPLWFTQDRVPQMAGIFDATPLVKQWLARMTALRQANGAAISSTEALAVAKSSVPKSVADWPFVDGHGIALGSQVSVNAESFGQEASVGELVAATATSVTLRRIDERAGTVHVHFPRIGFALKKLDA